ncbi:MAG TPA: c-type cytochrome [Rubricoccaceae bacterium]|nr:c-type cytochrome [Rubricoccaceae bacterium]
MSKIPPVGRLVVPLFFFALLGLAAYAPSPAPAARPPAPADTGRWENLLVLPDTLSRDEIRDIMRGFGRALGVRCSHCHVREGEDFDFASDAKPEKEVARGMIRMTWQLNAEIFPAMGPALAALHEGEAHAPMAVTCWTCHRGESHPPEPPPPPPEEGEAPPPPQEEHQHDHEHEHH